MRPVDEQMQTLMRGVDFGDAHTHKVMEGELRARLAENRPLRVYCGFDPTGPDLHFGHTVPMRKMRQFQDLGHAVTFLIGTFTGLIGDPSGKDKARPQQTSEQVAQNEKDWLDQVFKILDREKTIIRRNGDWLGKLTFGDVINLASNFTVQQFLERESFDKRFRNGDPIWIHEFFYALMQGYDAVAMDTDVQIGGTEQLFNLMVGRKLQEVHGQRPQVALTFPILTGTDGTQRMGKSLGNYVGINEAAEVIYGKTMSIPDTSMRSWMDLLTRWSPADIAAIEAEVAGGRLHPRDAKMKLAREMVSIFHNDAAAQAAEEHFKRVYQERAQPIEMPEYTLAAPTGIVDLILAAGLAVSKSEARRLIQQNAVRLDDQTVASIEQVVAPKDGMVLNVGKHKFLRLRA
ncbi:MAG: tyrosine--tRNA ligase [Chloroflexi bacterium]|nr:tyrosine--tRNA ligase [Chloroflexota bacterium]